jgi:hypothetical protein
MSGVLAPFESLVHAEAREDVPAGGAVDHGAVDGALLLAVPGRQRQPHPAARDRADDGHLETPQVLQYGFGIAGEDSSGALPPELGKPVDEGRDHPGGFSATPPVPVTGTEEVPANRAVVTLFSRLVGSAAASASGSLIGNMVNADGTRLTLSFRIYNSATGHFMDESRFRGFLSQLRRTVAENPVGEAKPVIWGEILRSLSLADSLRRFLIISMVISLALIFAVAAITFRSPIFGRYAVMPLAAGLMLNFILMALLRIPLDMTTIMVANITIGVGIDGGIYLVIQYQREIRRHPGDFPKAIGQTLHVMGRAIILSTFSIVMALLVFTSAAFKPIVYFGLLVIFSLSATAAGTLTVLPALLNVDSRFRGRSRTGRKGRRRPDPTPCTSAFFVP